MMLNLQSSKKVLRLLYKLLVIANIALLVGLLLYSLYNPAFFWNVLVPRMTVAFDWEAEDHTQRSSIVLPLVFASLPLLAYLVGLRVRRYRAASGIALLFLTVFYFLHFVAQPVQSIDSRDPLLMYAALAGISVAGVLYVSRLVLDHLLATFLLPIRLLQNTFPLLLLFIDSKNVLVVLASYMPVLYVIMLSDFVILITRRHSFRSVEVAVSYLLAVIVNIGCLILYFGKIFSLLGLKDANTSEMSYQLSTGLYYSVVTWTTLGYGDVTPISGLARFFAAAEAITGLLIVPLLTAGVISLMQTVSELRKSESGEYADMMDIARSFDEIDAIRSEVDFKIQNRFAREFGKLRELSPTGEKGIRSMEHKQSV
jgi:hypothetical protein